MDDVPALGRFPGIAVDRLSDEQKTSLERLVGNRGFLPAPYRAWIVTPYVVDAYNELGTNLRRGGLTPRELEIAILVTAAYFGAPFVLGAHRRAGARAGLSADLIETLAAGKVPDLADPQEAMVEALARALLYEKTIGADFAASAEAELGLGKIVEIIGLMGSYAATSLTMKFFDVPA